jgi:transcriptional regulator with GAF, ATPase, and Fis domain
MPKAPSTLRWAGDLRPPAGVVRGLARVGVAIEEAGSVAAGGHAGGARVVATRGQDAPRGPAEASPWIWVTARPPAPGAVEEAVLRGAYDCLALSAPDFAARLAARAADLAMPAIEVPQADTFLAESEGGRRTLAQIARAARTSQPVLLTGETGTGKDVAARLLHAWSGRRDHRFVPVNCAAIPNDLMEAELFGYARGAFSGAVRAYDGQIAAAEGGTVFLDEIDDTPLSLQVKLLRVLEDRVVSRLGENEWRRVDFRLVAATNRDLGPLIAEGRFGADLFERLAIVSIQLPPLRERPSDIAPLAGHFIARFYVEEPDAFAHRVREITSPALTALTAYPWPGNVRELRNVVYQALVDKRAGTELLLSDLPRRVLRRTRAAAGGPVSLVPPSLLDRALASGSFNLRVAVDDLERAALHSALAMTGGNAADGAEEAGRAGRDPGSTVRSMMRRLGVSPGGPRRLR